MEGASAVTIGRTSLGLFYIALLVTTANVHPAQSPSQMSRVGWLCSQHPTSAFQHFVTSLQSRGYSETRNVRIEQRYAFGDAGRLKEHAVELVKLKVDVIVTCDYLAIQPARNATSTIPIVMVVSGDPVGSGFVRSLAQPGGNVTGLSNVAPELMPKRLELLRELVPYLKQVAVLGVSESLEWKEVKSACDKNGIGLITLDIRRYKDLPEAFNIAATGKASGLIVLPSPRTNSRAGEIVELANRAKLPAIYPTEFYTSRGGLMSYGPSLPEMARRAAEYVDQILKGAKPGDLPIQQPKTFELIINAKTAKSLGLVIPSSLQLQAHSVIE